MIKKLMLLMSFSCFVLAGINDNNNAWMRGSTSNDKPSKRENHGFFFRGDVKALKVQEENLSFVLERDDTSAFTDLRAINPDFDWNLGFRAGLGYITGHDDIEMNANWYYVYGKGDRTVEKQSDITLIPTWYEDPNLKTLDEASIHLKVQAHQVDLNLAKLFVVGSRLFLKAMAGLETMWMRQGYTIKYLVTRTNDEVETDVIGNRMRFWGIGPKFALHSFWQLFSKVGPIAEVNASMLYGVLKTTYNRKLVTNDTTPQERLINHYRITRFVLNALLGLEFRHWFEKSDVHLRFRLGWENAIYFDQNRYIIFNKQPASGSFTMGPGDLAYQGWIFGFYLGF